jgi:hypothetical protein
MSKNSLRIHDIESAREIIDYETQDDASKVLDIYPETGTYYRLAHP